MMNETQTLSGLVEQYSPSTRERNAVEWLVERMHALGFTDAFMDGAGNAVGKIGSGPKQVLLLGHIDTVAGEIPVRVEEGILYGRGCVDAKGALACFVDAAAEVGAREGWQFVVIGAVDEERDSTGARFVVDQYAPDFAIIGEPNRWDRVSLGYKGSAWANVYIQRKQAHTASSEPTACERGVAIWLSIQGFAEAFNLGKERAFDKVLASLQAFESGTEEFHQWARLHVTARLPLEISPEQWYQRLWEITASTDGNVKIEPVGSPVPAWQCQKNTPLVRVMLAAIRSQGGTPSFVYKTGTADLNIVAPAWGCPTLVYGPGDSAYDHTPDEQIRLEEYVQAVRVLSTALKSLTG
jgi:[amino group carrier protein]-lysine/ornithine hydrolase